MNVIQSAIRTFRMSLIRLFPEAFNHPFGFPELCLAESPIPRRAAQTKNVLESILDKGFLWAVPKARRSLERRMTRRLGLGKPILPKNNIIVCEACGHFHPVHTVCGNCYETVKKETKLMQDAVMEEFKLDPIEQEVVIVYENDPKKTYEGKRIVEVPRERPQWFSRNLLMKDSEIPRKKISSVRDSSFSPEVKNDTS